MVRGSTGPLIVHNCENATQATAGSRLREANRVLSPAPELDGMGAEIEIVNPGNAEIVGHTHDEQLAECDDDEDSILATAKWLGDEMARIPGWLEGCPMVAELQTHWWYTKAKGLARDL